MVGAFFVLSGYVVAYTATELGEYKASPRISPAPQFIMARIMGRGVAFQHSPPPFHLNLSRFPP